ncbi:MAG: thrombospondin type 3 repeat-containing protein [Verrucomicrobiota bacterium]|jgi:hypothetical protein|nr:thrombospondin type 3 repeat-containing protein [Verrucomicrobiota bacterium]
MKWMNRHARKHAPLALAAWLLAPPALLASDFADSVHVGTLMALHEPSGQVVGDGSLLELREVGPGIQPIREDGAANPINTLIDCFQMGAGVIRPGSGTFSAGVSDLGAVRYFVRAYSAATVGESTYYADSEPFDLSDIDGARRTVVVSFPSRVMRAIQPCPDADADGLCDDEEAAHGSDPNLWSTAGDDFSDKFKVDHGLDPTLPYAFEIALESDVVSNPLASANKGEPPFVQLFDVVWHAVSGMTYRVEFAPSLQNFAEGADVWSVQTVVPRQTGDYALPVDDWVHQLDPAILAHPSPMGFFRVLAVPPMRNPQHP